MTEKVKLMTVDELMALPDPPMLSVVFTVVGPQGSGKTTALKAVREALREYFSFEGPEVTRDEGSLGVFAVKDMCLRNRGNEK